MGTVVGGAWGATVVALLEGGPGAVLFNLGLAAAVHGPLSVAPAILVARRYARSDAPLVTAIVGALPELLLVGAWYAALVATTDGSAERNAVGLPHGVPIVAAILSLLLILALSLFEIEWGHSREWTEVERRERIVMATLASPLAVLHVPVVLGQLLQGDIVNATPYAVGLLFYAGVTLFAASPVHLAVRLVAVFLTYVATGAFFFPAFYYSLVFPAFAVARLVKAERRGE